MTLLMMAALVYGAHLGWGSDWVSRLLRIGPHARPKRVGCKWID